jgi:hypothetical protein
MFISSAKLKNLFEGRERKKEGVFKVRTRERNGTQVVWKTAVKILSLPKKFPKKKRKLLFVSEGRIFAA